MIKAAASPGIDVERILEIAEAIAPEASVFDASLGIDDRCLSAAKLRAVRIGNAFCTIKRGSIAHDSGYCVTIHSGRSGLQRCERRTLVLVLVAALCVGMPTGSGDVNGDLG
jgi:hypothetical protein